MGPRVKPGEVKPGHDGAEGSVSYPTTGQSHRTGRASRIHREDEIDLPLSRPMLDGLFPLDRSGSRVVAFVINQHLDAISFRKAWYEAFPELKGATDQIIGDANVKRAAPTISEEVDPESHS